MQNFIIMKSIIKGHKVNICSKLFDLIKKFGLRYYGQLSSLFSLILVRKFILWQNYTFFRRNVASLGKIHILKIFTRFFCFRIYISDSDLVWRMWLILSCMGRGFLTINTYELDSSYQIWMWFIFKYIYI